MIGPWEGGAPPAFYCDFPEEEPCWSCDGHARGEPEDLCFCCRAETEREERAAEGHRCRAWRERQGVTLEQIEACCEGDTRCHTSAEVADMEAGTHESDPDTWLPAIVETVARVLAGDFYRISIEGDAA